MKNSNTNKFYKQIYNVLELDKFQL